MQQITIKIKPEDVKSIRPDWSDEKIDLFLNDWGVEIQSEMESYFDDVLETVIQDSNLDNAEAVEPDDDEEEDEAGTGDDE